MNSRTITGTIAGIAALGVAFSTLGTPPSAQAAPQDGQDRFPISVEEIDARRVEVFVSVDSNGDGLISAEEFAAAELPKGRRGGQHKQRGGDGDEEAWAARREAMEEDLFFALDANADGVISRDEFSTEAMREARQANRKSRLFERADQDGDGYLSPDEFPPRRMAQLDANGDGEITRDELPAHPDRRAWNRDAG